MAKDLKTIGWYVDRAAHLIAIDSHDVYLFDETERPWEYVDQIEDGAVWRYGVSCSVAFIALHPCGLRFRWSEDLEGRNANGSASLQPDVSKWRRIAGSLTKTKRVELVKVLSGFAEAMGAQAQDYSATANRLLAQRDVLRSIAKDQP